MTRQEEQQTVMQEALDAPGVRELIEVYAPIAPFAGTQVVRPLPQMAYATGGNA